MNYSIIRFVVGKILMIEAGLMVLPLTCSLVYRETKGGLAFLITIALCLCSGYLLSFKKPSNKVFYAKEGFVATALSWILMSFLGSLPFVISKEIPHPAEAFFETVSGFTTTGASILTDVEVLSHGMLFWRSFTHWVGGMGILVFMLAVLPQTNAASQMNLMKAESPGPSVGKLVPKVGATAKYLYIIYMGLTLMQMVLLLIGGMPVFDTLCMSFGTAGTGGFGVLNSSAGSYTVYQQVVITVFMLLFGVNFNAYFFIVTKKFSQALAMEEVRAYFAIVGSAILMITINIYHLFGNVLTALQQSSFQVASIITTTGFSTVDFDQWPVFSRTVLVALMFVGACAGSTGGGVKVSRFVILTKQVHKELHFYLHPNAIRKVKIDNKPVPHEVVRATDIFLIVYILIYMVSMLLISLDNYDFTTNFTAVAATINNIGPGLSQVGPAMNYHLFSVGSKLILSFDMLAGRLELFPLLILFFRRTWRKFD